MTVVLDISRLIARQGYATPTGIDRFELNYACWVRNRIDRKAIFVETNPAGPAIVNAARARLLIDNVSHRWADSTLSAAQERQLEAIVAAIEGRRVWHVRARDKRGTDDYHPPILANGAARAMRSLASAWSSLPAEGLFVHVSHARLDRGAAFSWLHGPRPRGVFYVHDLIPLSHPEYVRVGEPERHLARMKTVLRHARLVLCNSQVTARVLDRLAEANDLPQPRSAILPPGVDDAFIQLPKGEAVSTSRPYFVCVGTIEPRKNHALLLNIWRRLIERDGDTAPRLVLIGRRGWDNSQLFKLLDRPETLRNTVIEVPDLGDAPLARLVAGASALLAPSFIEGYGMPVAEALALGTPVIASNIQSHREIAGRAGVLLDPLNGGDWLCAIDAYKTVRRRRPRRGISGRGLWTWSNHFHALERILAADGLESTHISSCQAEIKVRQISRARSVLGGWLNFANMS